MTDKPLVIIGAGGHGKVVLETAQVAGFTVAGFLDSQQPVGSFVLGARILGHNARLEEPEFLQSHRFIVAIGHQEARRELSLKLLAAGAELAIVAHPTVLVSPSATIGEGTVLVAGTIINAQAKIGRYCIVNTGATLDHDNVLEDGVQVCPGVHLAGNVYCGEGVFIGTGAVAIPGVKIGAHAVIGAGAVVLQDVPAGVLAVGNPAMVKPK